MEIIVESLAKYGKIIKVAWVHFHGIHQFQ